EQIPVRWPSYHLLLTRLQKCLFFVSVVTGQNMEVTQVPETVSVTAGGNLTLKCTLTGRNLFRSVQWYKGLDRNQAPIYSDKRGASNRGVRVIPGSTRDFSINIQNVHPEDAGTYYCVKFTTLFTWRELASGKGTLVSVTAKPSQSVIHGPARRIMAGSQASFLCYSEGFSPHENPPRPVMLSQPKLPHRAVVVGNRFLE
uniref:Ig-like domain-containing protein n=1 Tax=Naja naja TaxID=35670 RepID=A0A8C6VG76_NAJNA